MGKYIKSGKPYLIIQKKFKTFPVINCDHKSMYRKLPPHFSLKEKPVS